MNDYMNNKIKKNEELQKKIQDKAKEEMFNNVIDEQDNKEMEYNIKNGYLEIEYRDPNKPYEHMNYKFTCNLDNTDDDSLKYVLNKFYKLFKMRS